ncbi:ddaF [Symbiodinium natans]|uniref:DdaF protein n=1 Tax=Symbiodinium natans TaxID=878477 RepID=A0A812H002_9DINO|nr:ddaF [Symbiodinium natans]
MASRRELDLLARQEDDADKDSPNELIARFLIRAALRAASGQRQLRRTLVLVCGYPPKAAAVDSAFSRFSQRSVCLHPYCCSESPDSVADLLVSKGFKPLGLVPFADCAVHMSDVMNARLGVPHNDPATSSFRRDKYLQQEVLRAAGLPAPLQIVTSDAAAAKEFAMEHGRVVVKPRNASGGDGVWLCDLPEDVEKSLEQELGKAHQELGTNTEMVVVQALLGEEWIVNTVTRDGVHKVSDVWYGPAKFLSPAPGPRHFVYNVQFLAGESPRLLEVVQMVKDSLSALGLRNGAAHTELVWLDRPYLYEVNARCSGGLPRVPEPPTQLDVLAMSLCDPDSFLALPDVPPESMTNRAAVVFLIAPFDGWLTATGLRQMSWLSTFARFERGLTGAKAPFMSIKVSKTVGLFSSPGALVLHGDGLDVQRDAQLLRQIEETAYATSRPEDDLAPPQAEEQ